MPGQDLTAVIQEEKIQNQCTKVTYPQVQGLKNQTVQNQINQLIKKQVMDLIPPEGCDVYAEILGIYEVEVNQKGILSLRFEFYSIRKQAANGSTVQKSITVDLESGRVYQLYDLFKRDSGYKVVINKMIRDQIKEREIPLIREFTGITDNQEFYLTGNDLVIYFQEIEITPHYVGIPEFKIPYRLIRNLVREDSPIARLISQD